MVPQQNCDEAQSSGPSQASTAPPWQLPPAAMHVDDVVPVPLFTVTQHDWPTAHVIEPQPTPLSAMSGGGARSGIDMSGPALFESSPQPATRRRAHKARL